MVSQIWLIGAYQSSID